MSEPESPNPILLVLTIFFVIPTLGFLAIKWIGFLVHTFGGFFSK